MALWKTIPEYTNKPAPAWADKILIADSEDANASKHIVISWLKNSLLQNDSNFIDSAWAPIQTVNTKSWEVVLWTDDIAEWVTNKYFNWKTLDDLPDWATYKRSTNDYTTPEKGKVALITNWWPWTWFLADDWIYKTPVWWWDVIWPLWAINNNIAVYDWTTWKNIKEWWVDWLNFNTADKLVKLDWTWKLPALNWENLTNLSIKVERQEVVAWVHSLTFSRLTNIDYVLIEWANWYNTSQNIARNAASSWHFDWTTWWCWYYTWSSQAVSTTQALYTNDWSTSWEILVSSMSIATNVLDFTMTWWWYASITAYWS